MILSFVLFNTTQQQAPLVCSKFISVLVARFAFTTLRANQIKLYDAIKSSYEMPPRWTSGYETLSPMSFFEAFSFIINQMHAKKLLSFDIIALIMELAELDRNDTDTELKELSSTLKTIHLAMFDCKAYGNGYSLHASSSSDFKVLGKHIFFTIANGKRHFFFGRYAPRVLPIRKNLLENCFVDSSFFFDLNGFFKDSARFADHVASHNVSEPQIINHSMKTSGGLGLMVPDGSTKYTPKRAKITFAEATGEATEATEATE